MPTLTDTIVKIRHYVETNTLEQHVDDYEIKQMFKHQPRLYKMVTMPNCDMTMLFNLVTLQEKIQHGSMKSEDAEKEFGEIAAKRYVYPLVDK